MQKTDILYTPIKQLKVSKRFKSISEIMKLSTLQEALALAPTELRQSKYFDYVWYEEFVGILSAHELEYLLLVRQGNSRV